MAKKAGGSSRNGRDMLGRVNMKIKWKCTPGNIIIRKRNKIFPGENVKMEKTTLYFLWLKVLLFLRKNLTEHLFPKRTN